MPGERINDVGVDPEIGKGLRNGWGLVGCLDIDGGDGVELLVVGLDGGGTLVQFCVGLALLIAQDLAFRCEPAKARLVVAPRQRRWAGAAWLVGRLEGGRGDDASSDGVGGRLRFEERDAWCVRSRSLAGR